MIVLDASVLIAFLDGADAHHDAATDLLAGALDEDLAANSLTLAEVLVGPERADRLDAARTALEDLEVEELSFPVDTAVKQARLRASTGLRMPDCCVLLAAEEAAASIASFDVRLRQAAGQRDLTVLPR